MAMIQDKDNVFCIRIKVKAVDLLWWTRLERITSWESGPIGPSYPTCPSHPSMRKLRAFYRCIHRQKENGILEQWSRAEFQISARAWLEHPKLACWFSPFWITY